MSRQQSELFQTRLHTFEIGLDELPSFERTDLQQAFTEILAQPVEQQQVDVAVAGSEPWPAQTRLIGLCGYARSGKDSVAEHFRTTYKGVRCLSISSEIIRISNKVLRPFEVQITEWSKNNYESHRHFLQALADAKRTYDRSYWADLVAERARLKLEADPRVKAILITGLRTHEEIAAVKQLQGSNWRISRPNNPYRTNHPNEAQIDQLSVDYDLINDKTLPELMHKADDLLRSI